MGTVLECTEDKGECEMRVDGICTASRVIIDFDGQYWTVSCPKEQTMVCTECGSGFSGSDPLVCNPCLEKQKVIQQVSGILIECTCEKIRDFIAEHVDSDDKADVRVILDGKEKTFEYMEFFERLGFSLGKEV